MITAIDREINHQRQVALGNGNAVYNQQCDTVEWHTEQAHGVVCGVHEVVVIDGFGTCLREHENTDEIVENTKGSDYLQAMLAGVYSHLKQVNTLDFLEFNKNTVDFYV